MLQEALKWVTSQPAWQRSGGRDHVLPVHHPWSFKSHRRFMKHAIWLLPDLDSTGNWYIQHTIKFGRNLEIPELIISYWCWFCRYKPGEVSLEKDVILPYVANVEVCDTNCLENNRMHRATLLFFRGRTKRNAVCGQKYSALSLNLIIKELFSFLANWLNPFIAAKSYPINESSETKG